MTANTDLTKDVRDRQGVPLSSRPLFASQLPLVSIDPTVAVIMRICKDSVKPLVDNGPMSVPLPNPEDFDATWKYISGGLDLVLRTPGVGMSKQRYIGLVT
jgi:hypothetical protein